MSSGSIPGFHFQFDVSGKAQNALISHEALEKCFGGSKRAPELAYRANISTIHEKAREIFMSSEVRIPFMLNSTDFEKIEK